MIRLQEIRTLLFVFAVALTLQPLGNRCAHGQITRSFTEPVEQSEVAAAEAGVVVSVFVEEGESVTAGQPLAELDRQPLKQSLKIAQLRADSTSELESAEAMLQIKATRRKTIEAMLGNGHANPAEVEEATLEHEMALAKVREQREKQNEYKLEVDRIQSQLDSRMIFAPIDGVVSEIHRRKGEYIASTAPQYATIVRFNELIARFYLLETEVRRLSAGDEVNLRVRVGDQQREVTGRVKFVSPVTDSDSGTARVEVLIENSGQLIRSGSPCEWLGCDGRSGAPGGVDDRE